MRSSGYLEPQSEGPSIQSLNTWDLGNRPDGIAIFVMQVLGKHIILGYLDRKGFCPEDSLKLKGLNGPQLLVPEQGSLIEITIPVSGGNKPKTKTRQTNTSGTCFDHSAALRHSLRVRTARSSQALADFCIRALRHHTSVASNSEKPQAHRMRQILR